MKISLFICQTVSIETTLGMTISREVFLCHSVVKVLLINILDRKAIDLLYLTDNSTQLFIRGISMNSESNRPIWIVK